MAVDYRGTRPKSTVIKVVYENKTEMLLNRRNGYFYITSKNTLDLFEHEIEQNYVSYILEKLFLKKIKVYWKK